MSVARYFDEMSYGPAPEADGDARAWLKKHEGGFGHFIGGASVKPAGGKYFDVFEPATDAKIARVAQGDQADVDAAVAAARKAQGPWSKLSGHARARHLYALARAVQRHGRLLSVVEAIDNGKPIRETRDIDIPLVARHFYYHAGWAQLQATEFADQVPVGVVGQIIPWNFPLLMLAWKVAPALALGNTVVLKASELCPGTHRLIAECLTDAGLPPGVVNVVTNAPTDAAAVVEALIAHPAVRRINFTGSTRVGRIIAETAGRYLKPVLLELGGKAPMLVLDDADIDEAVKAAAFGAFMNQGQICMSPERLAGGRAEGAIMDAAVLDHVTPDMSIYHEESFGPVVCVVRAQDTDDAVRIANDTEYGLSAAVFSRNIARAMDVARRIESGICHVNGPTVHDEAQMPFGGTKASGYGRFGGKAGMDQFTELRWITIETQPGRFPI